VTWTNCLTSKHAVSLFFQSGTVIWCEQRIFIRIIMMFYQAFFFFKVPETWQGKIIASFCALLGISFFALPAVSHIWINIRHKNLCKAGCSWIKKRTVVSEAITMMKGYQFQVSWRTAGANKKRKKLLPVKNSYKYPKGKSILHFIIKMYVELNRKLQLWVGTNLRPALGFMFSFFPFPANKTSRLGKFNLMRFFGENEQNVNRQIA
jgi:hypothetical protein